MTLSNRMLGYDTDELRLHARGRREPGMQRRRAVVGLQLAGIAAMGLTTLLQFGVVKRLPDPLLRRLRTRRVNLSDEAFGYGGPDSPVVILIHALNLLLATTGGADRARRDPWLPLAAAGLAGAQAGMAAKYLFHQMPYVDEAYCPYCIADAIVHFATLGLVVPEALEAAEELLGRRAL